jgi:putative ABC transport system permease protein
MGTMDIDWINLGVGLLLLGIPLYFLGRYKTGLVRPTLVAAARMIVQLLLIGVYLRILFEWDNPWVNFLWVVVMTAVAAETALTRTRLKRRVLMVPVTLAFLTTVTLVGFYFLGFVLQLDAIFSARYFIPVFGIIMGNMLGVNVMGLNTYYSGLQRERQLYLYLLGNGATRHEATAPFVRQALVKAFSPGIANMAVTGLVALPGTMIGQILGGSSPNVAIKYQIMIIVITTASSMLSLIITLALASRRSFDAYGRLLNVYQEDKR